MDKGRTQSVDDRVRGLIEEAAGEVAKKGEVPAGDRADSPLVRGGERGASVRRNEPTHKRRGSGSESNADSVDRADVNIYGAHPRDD